MPAYTYQEIDFRIPVKEGFYSYEQKVSPAYRVCGTGINWASLVVHRIPGNRQDQWFVSEQTTGAAIETPGDNIERRSRPTRHRQNQGTGARAVQKGVRTNPKGEDMAQPITTADVHRGTFHCQTCDTELPVFYHRRCPTCHAEFTLLSADSTG